MGTDIHCISEIKHHGRDWQVWQRANDGRSSAYRSNLEMDCVSGRSYTWFGILAGVRIGFTSKPIASDRGLPNDASEEAKQWLEENQYHSVTWCSLKELERSIDKFSKVVKKEQEDPYQLEPAPGIFVELGSSWQGYVDASPIRKAYEDICAEAEFLGIPKPKIRIIIGFDS